MCRDDGAMIKRGIGAFLWFAAVWFGFELLWSIAGVPRLAGPVFGAAVAVLVILDPGSRLWGSHAHRPRSVRGLAPAAAMMGKHQ